MSIAADGVVFDLNGKSIVTTPEFLMRQARAPWPDDPPRGPPPFTAPLLADQAPPPTRQRFFSVIELAAKPFLANVGPPQFGSSSSPLNAATNVLITNGTLGTSSHHGIHGNENQKVWVHGVHIKDFEVGGAHFNGGSDIYLSDTDIGPSLGALGGSATNVPALATLSQATLLLRTAACTKGVRPPSTIASLGCLCGCLSALAP